MADVIKCPACGKNNLPDQEFCQHCLSRLQPLTGNLKGEDGSLKPGQIPTKKNTSELEPILPQWLREARSSGRKTSAEEAAQQAPEINPASSGVDLLAGLQAQRQSQDGNEEDTPDWLANITGETPKTQKPQTESSDVRWVELGDKNDFAQSEPADATPDWLIEMTSSAPQSSEKDEMTNWTQDAGDVQKSQEPVQPISFDTPPSVQPAAESQDWLHSMVSDDRALFTDSDSAVDESPISSDTPDWLRAMAAENEAQNVTASTPPSASSDTPDWLRAMAAESDAQNVSESVPPPASSDTPDWLRAMAAESDAQNIGESVPPPASSDTPDWLRAMAAEGDAQNVGESVTPPASSDTPDWLSTMEMDTQEKTQSADSASVSETGMGESAAVFSSIGDTPDWLKDLESNASLSDQDWLKGLQADKSEQPVQDSTPAWASAAPTPAPEEPLPVVSEQEDDAALDLPSWLKAAAPQSSIFDEPEVEQKMPPPVPSTSDTSDWLEAFKSADMPEGQPVPAFSEEVPVDSALPASKDIPKTGADKDALFTDMPDWLSIVDDTAASESMPEPITNVDAISPGDLPSWVQAMRPVDAGAPELASTSLSDSKVFESRGALAGLQGVLPAAAGFLPTSKPKAYSIKLQASEEQQSHALLLEQILAAETAPVPIGSFSVLATSRGLRWFLAFLFFVVLTAVLFMRTQIFAMPVGFPAEEVSALNIVKDSIPEDARVLVMFDYEPSRAGEVEAAAVPMFDQLIRSRHPRLTFISTNATGAILAERFISSGPLAEIGYQSGSQYLNLGYLPGGQVGIRAFAENPAQTAQYPFLQNSNFLDFSIPAQSQTFPPLEGVSSLSNFGALILITDDADSARAWIEQTTSARGAVPFVVVSSAQAAPMIQPYYSSKQISGLVSGLHGGVLFEQNNEGRSDTVRRYWDAYSIGMLLAMALMLGGGLLNLALGLRDRALAREAK